MYRRILVATNGKPEAMGALRMARMLEQRMGSAVEVFAACEESDFYRMSARGRRGEALRQLPSTALDVVRSRVQAQLATVDEAAPAWRLTVEHGAPGPAIVRFAAQRECSLILLGLPALPAAEEAWFGRETLQAVVQLAHVPVYAVRPSTARMPASALVALDFSPFSLPAAWLVARLLPPGAKLHLAHVLMEPAENGDSWDQGLEWAERYHPAVEPRLGHLAAQIRGCAEISTQVHVLSGETAHAVLELASQLRTELLAMGSQGHGFTVRERAGSTCSRLLRAASCSLLIVPPDGKRGEIPQNPADAAAHPKADESRNHPLIV
jgi:nucleotide-binding universal stress UspA family protein